MIIDKEVKSLVFEIEKGDGDVDALIKDLIIKLGQNCKKAENQKRYQDYLTGQTKLEAYPIDKNGYAVSFDPLEDEEAFYKTWSQYGFVIGKQIVPQAECTHAINRTNEVFNKLSGGKDSVSNNKIDRIMPKDDNGTPLISRGFFELYHDDVLAQLRQNIRAYIHHVLIWGRVDLWTSFDRMGVKLPSHEDGKALPLHVDQNPNVHADFKTVQGVLALTDCPLARGTYKAVPGSRSRFPAYADMAKNNGEYVELDQSQPIAQTLEKHAQALPLRAGDMVTWDSRTTHANTSNLSNDVRMVFYMAAGPAREDKPELVEARKESLKTGLGSNVREALMHASMKPRYTNQLAIQSVRKKENLNLLGQLLYGTKKYKNIITPPAT